MISRQYGSPLSSTPACVRRKDCSIFEEEATGAAPCVFAPRSRPTPGSLARTRSFPEGEGYPASSAQGGGWDGGWDGYGSPNALHEDGLSDVDSFGSYSLTEANLPGCYDGPVHVMSPEEALSRPAIQKLLLLANYTTVQSGVHACAKLAPKAWRLACELHYGAARRARTS